MNSCFVFCYGAPCSDDDGPSRIDLLPRQFVSSNFGPLLEDDPSHRQTASETASNSRPSRSEDHEEPLDCHFQRVKGLLN